MTETQLVDFSNTEVAFRYKSLDELKQAEWMYKALNAPLIGTIGKSLLKFSIKAGLPVKGIVKATLYRHFVGGETLEGCLPVTEKLAKFNVKSILDYSEEGKESESEMEHAFQELMRNIRFSGGHAEMPFCVFKMTAFTSTPLLAKVSAGLALNPSEQAAWAKAKERFEALCRASFEARKSIMVDAEETWIQKAIDELTFDMMEKFNTKEVTVLNTFQMYRKDRLAYLKRHYDIATEKGYKLGVKLVRGAYMEKERKRAAELGYPSPIQDTKENSDKDYNTALQFCLERIENVMIVAGTHNEKSNHLAVDYIEKHDLPQSHPHLWFSQLYGMCDHLSFNLGHAGYNVAKYVPYGPVSSVTPYLIRRADENSSVAGQAGLEIKLLRKEINRRGASK